MPDGAESAAPEAQRQQQQQESAIQVANGSFAFVDGSRYEGQYTQKEGGAPLRHGHGTFTSGAEQYTGEWKDDKMCGQGRYVFASEAVYEGQFDDNKFHGQGRYTWPNGEREYVGQFADNKFHGEGKYTDQKKVVWEGVFHNGKFKSRKAYLLLS